MSLLISKALPDARDENPPAHPMPKSPENYGNLHAKMAPKQENDLLDILLQFSQKRILDWFSHESWRNKNWGILKAGVIWYHELFFDVVLVVFFQKKTSALLTSQ